ncbi:hypothetical protein ACMATS_19965 [Streptoverticillium reticulum]|uniref:hypothetical protein n=1 Tax=Streptoverticillium reticulum TaxID=1433415 RepID=UPI0039BF6E31
MTELRPNVLGLGRTAWDTAAAVEQDGTIRADAADSASLTVLRGRPAAWEDAGRPAPETCAPALIPGTSGDVPGWDLRLTR